MTGPTGDSEICFPSTSMFPEAKANSVFPLGLVIKCLSISVPAPTCYAMVLRCGSVGERNINAKLHFIHKSLDGSYEAKAMNEISSTSMSKIKKRVSFADAAGFTLEFVKIIPPHSGEDYVNIYSSNLWNVNNNYSRSLPSPPSTRKYLSPSFTEPYKTSSFFERVYSQNVCLESIVCHYFVVTGTIRVTNIAFAKEVTVRFTLDNWKSYRDIWADYLSSSKDGKTDKFWFRIAVPVDSAVDLEIKFAIRYCIGGQEFWDNNLDSNYKIQYIESRQ